MVDLGPRRPPIAQRPPGSATLPAFAVYAEAKKTKDLPEPGIRHCSTRHKQSFEPLEPEAGVAPTLVELDPRHAGAPYACFQHGALHSAPAPDAAGGRSNSNIAPGSQKTCDPPHTARIYFAGRACRSLHVI